MRDKSVRHDFHKLGMEKEMSLSPRVRRCPKAGFRKKHAKLAPCKAALEPVWQIALSSRQQALERRSSNAILELQRFFTNAH